MRPFTWALAVLAALAATAPALAGSPYIDGGGYFGSPSERAAAAAGVPNVPNYQGCIPWCQRDMNPCDPPLYKRTDGRCNYFN